jgi:hypothetical protein
MVEKIKPEKGSPSGGDPERKKKKPSTKEEMKRFARRPLPEYIQKTLQVQFPLIVPSCEPSIEKLNKALNEGCALRSEFIVESEKGCATGAGERGTPVVDLVVLIDTSGSMSDEATDLSNAAEQAITAAQQSCPSDLRVCWFGIEGTWVNTRFSQSYRNYFKGQAPPNKDDCRYSETPLNDADLKGYIADHEDGAAAIIDISEHFDWRPGATRAVFYLGDEALERGGPQDADDYAAADAAIDVVQKNGVTVYTYFGTPYYPDSAAETSSEYRRLAENTGGQFFNAPASNIGGFQAILEQIICASVRGRCNKATLPKLQPCFQLMWGDGPEDRIETDDVELMCIKASNPYANVTIKDLVVLISIVTEEDGSDVTLLPDRTRSVYVKPLYATCFGDLPPCDEKNQEVLSVSREFVLVSRGAKEGEYKLYLVYCYSIEVAYADIDSFAINLVKS